jgi:hypothetical protein
MDYCIENFAELYLMVFGVVFTTLHFLLTYNGPIKLECYITLSWKRLSGTNILAYWAHSKFVENEVL